MPYFVYIATNRSRTLYTGVTNNLQRRAGEHSSGMSRFTAKYQIDRIIYVETYEDVKGDRQRKANQRLATLEKDRTHRIAKSELVGRGKRRTLSAARPSRRPKPR